MLQKRSLWLIIVVLLQTACSSQSDLKFSDLPAGDAAHGEHLFGQSANGAPPCTTCHKVDDKPLSTAPSLKGIATTAATRKSGMTAPEYIFESITQPPAYIVSGYSNTMYTQFR